MGGKSIVLETASQVHRSFIFPSDSIEIDTFYLSQWPLCAQSVERCHILIRPPELVQVFPLLGTILSNTFYLVTGKEILRSRREGVLTINPLPMPFALACTAIWVTYGVMIDNLWVIAGNFIPMIYNVFAVLVAYGLVRTYSTICFPCPFPSASRHISKFTTFEPTKFLTVSITSSYDRRTSAIARSSRWRPCPWRPLWALRVSR